MTMSETSVPVIDLDDLEQQIRAVPLPKSRDDRLAELGRQVGRSLGALPGCPERTASVAPQLRMSATSYEDEAHAEIGSARDSEVSVDQALHGDSVAWAPNTPDAALAPRISKKRSRLSSHALALVVPLLLVTVGAGLLMVMRAGPMEGPGSKAPVIKADSAPMPQKPSQLAPGAAVPLPDPPKLASESPIFDTPHRVSAVSIKPKAASLSNGEPETTPLPPTKPRSLALTAPMVLVPADKPSQTKASVAGSSSFSIRLASSHSKSDALATLSRLKTQFPDVLVGGSINRVGGSGASALYLVHAGPLSRDAADKACSRLKASGENCVVVAS